MIKRIDSKGIPPAQARGNTLLIYTASRKIQANKMTLKMINHLDRKGIPPALSQGEYPYYLYGFKEDSTK